MGQLAGKLLQRFNRDFGKPETSIYKNDEVIQDNNLREDSQNYRYDYDRYDRG